MREFCRNSMSESLRRTIEDIKEITGQHSDEDIYEMLKECNMDPNETAQKLLYLDTFHEVKRKRDRRKVQPPRSNQYSCYKSAGGRKPNLGRQESNRAGSIGGHDNPSEQPVWMNIAHKSSQSVGLYSSSTDPVLVPSLNPRNPGSVGIIKRETGNDRINGGHSMVFGQVDLGGKTQEAESSTTSLQQDKGYVAAPHSLSPPSQHNLHTSVRQSVIFPNYLHVPEAFKNSLTFGSLEASLPSPPDASLRTNTQSSKEPSVMPQSSSSVSGCSDPSPSHVPVNLNSSQQNASSGTPQRHDHSKQEMPDYFIPPVVGSHPLQLEGLETQGGNSTQPRGVSQSSIAAVSPQMFPFIRQTYPPNYIPYNPYFSQLYMPPQNPHQLLSHSGFPHQPSPTNMYMPPPAASSGVKFPHKPGNVAPNMSHYGISYGTSGLGNGPSSPLPPQPCSSDDIAGPELKDKNTYSTLQQNEDLHALACASGRDPSTLQTNVMYNLPQAQAIAFQAAHNSYPGIYHPSQSMPTRSLVQPIHQAQPTGAALEPTVPPLASYSQPQPQLLPLPQQQYGQMNWNQKFMNRENV